MSSEIERQTEGRQEQRVGVDELVRPVSKLQYLSVFLFGLSGLLLGLCGNEVAAIMAIVILAQIGSEEKSLVLITVQRDLIDLLEKRLNHVSAQQW